MKVLVLFASGCALIVLGLRYVQASLFSGGAALILAAMFLLQIGED